MALDLLTVLGKHIQGNDNELPILYFVEVGEALYHPVVGHAIVFEHQIPVVLDGDSSGHHPHVTSALTLHPIPACGDAGQRLATTLFPL